MDLRVLVVCEGEVAEDRNGTVRLISRHARSVIRVFLARVELSNVFVRVVFLLTGLFYVVPPIPYFRFLAFSFAIRSFLWLDYFHFNVLSEVFPRTVRRIGYVFQILHRIIDRLVLYRVIRSRRLYLFRAGDGRLFRRFLIIVNVTAIARTNVYLVSVLSRFAILDVLRRQDATKFLRDGCPLAIFSIYLNFLYDSYGGYVQ